MEFKRKIRRVGQDSYMVTIPKAFITNKTIEVNKEYQINISEIPETQ